MTLLYDLLVVHGTYWALWGCPWPNVAALYNSAIHPGARVLEVGPGTGFFLDRIDRPDLQVHLLDLHAGSLKVSARRLARYRPTTYQHNALEPFPLEEGSVDVAVLSMVLHCLPGSSIVDKASVFDHIAITLPRGGVCIGATVLARGVGHTALGRAGLRSLNARRVFNNCGDSLSDLGDVLYSRFDRVKLAVCGSVALWQVSAR
jgi:SAM-dependent methyltransferase